MQFLIQKRGDMEDRRDAQKTSDDLDKLMNSVVFFDLDEMVRVTNKAIEHGGSVVLNVRDSSGVAQRNDRYKQTCSESPKTSPSMPSASE